MGVTNKTIRELESAAVEAVLVMKDVIEVLGTEALFDTRKQAAVHRLRLASAALDRAETACSRERTLTMSEPEMREEYEALGLDWDEVTERGQALLQRLLAEYDARREAFEIVPRPGAPIRVALGSSLPMPGEDCRMVAIIGYANTEACSFWVSDHGLTWVRGVGETPRIPLPSEISSWDMTPEVDAKLAKHFDGIGPLTDEAISEARERGRRARGSRS